MSLDLSEERFPHSQVPPGTRTIEYVALFVRWPVNEATAPDSGHHRIVAASRAGVAIPESAIFRNPTLTIRQVYDWTDILKP